MSDLDLHELLSAYLDDEVTPTERTRVEEWLASSDEARRELDELRSLSCLLRESVVANAPSDLVASVLLRTAEDPPGVPISHAPTDSAAPVPHRPRDDARGWIVTGISLLITAAALLLVLRGLSTTVPVGPAGSSGDALAKTERTGTAEVAARDAEGRPEVEDDAAGRAADVRVVASGTVGGESPDVLAKKGFADEKAAPAGGKESSTNRKRSGEPQPRAVAESSPGPAAPPSVPSGAPQPSATAGGFGGAGAADKVGRARQPVADRDRTGSLGMVELAEGLQAGDVLPYLDGAAVVELTVIDVRRSYGELQLLLAKQGIELAQPGTGADGNATPAGTGRGELRRGTAPFAGPNLGSADAPTAAPAPIVAPGAAAPAVPSDPQAPARGGPKPHPTEIAEQAKSKDAAGPYLVAVLVQAPEAALAGILDQLEQDELVADLRLLDGTFVAVPERREQVLALQESVREGAAFRTADAVPHAGSATGAPSTPQGSRPKSAEIKVAGIPSAAPSRDSVEEGGTSPKRGGAGQTAAAKPTGAASPLADPRAARSLGRPASAAPGSPQGAASEQVARNQFGEWLQRRNAVQNAQPARKSANTGNTTNTGNERIAAKGTRPETEAAAATATPIGPANSSRSDGNAPAPAPAQANSEPLLQQQFANGRAGQASNAFRMPLNGPDPSSAANRRSVEEQYVQSRVVEKTDALPAAPAAPKSEAPADVRRDEQADRKARGQTLPADDPTLVRMIFVLRTSPETDRAEPAPAVPSAAPAAK